MGNFKTSSRQQFQQMIYLLCERLIVKYASETIESLYLLIARQLLHRLTYRQKRRVLKLKSAFIRKVQGITIFYRAVYH